VLQVLDRHELVFGQQVAPSVVDAGLPGNRAGRLAVVANLDD
jgi:hypothetical protein